MNVLPKVEPLFQPKTFLHDIDFVDGEVNKELARRNIQKFEKSIGLL